MFKMFLYCVFLTAVLKIALDAAGVSQQPDLSLSQVIMAGIIVFGLFFWFIGRQFKGE